MDLQQCYEAIDRLLPTLATYRYLKSTAGYSVRLGKHFKEGEDANGAKELLITCQSNRLSLSRVDAEDHHPHRTSVDVPSHVPVGSASPSRGRGWFETPPPSVTILYDSPGLVQDHEGPRPDWVPIVQPGSGQESGDERSSGGVSPATLAALSVLLQHELVHAVDTLVHGMDLSLCGHLAISEVRAAASAECATKWPGWAQRQCVQTLAAASTSMAFPSPLGPECVQVVLRACHPSRMTGVVEDIQQSPLAPGHCFKQALDAEERKTASRGR